MEQKRNISSRVNRRRPGCRGCGIGCLLLLLLLAALLCGAFYLLSPRSAHALQADKQQSLAVLLLIDNSNSMFEKDGIGSDPDLLRIDAARLFLAYLGVDESDLTHHAGVIFFGGKAETAVPLTPLTDDRQRAQLFDQISDPPRLGWTDHLAALQLAQEEIKAAEGNGRPAIILLTDGRPEWPDMPTVTTQDAYQNALQAQSEALATAGIPLFIILLANEATVNDAAIADIWQPLWQQMSQAVPPGRFFVAQTAGDLLPIYHDIVAALTGEQTAGVVVTADAPARGTVATFAVQPGLAQLTLVISKADPAQQVTVETADGERLTAVSPNVRRAGGDRATTEEVWVVERPAAGDWTVRVTGPGVVTIWQDYKLLPPIATSTTDAASALSAGVPQSTRWPTATPALTASPPWPAPTALLASSIALPTHTPQTAVMAQITPEIALPALNSVDSRDPVWLTWFLGSLFFLIVVGTGGLWVLSGRQPRVSGALRILGGAQLPERVIDLDSLRKTAVTLGKPPADIPLAGAEAQALIRPGEWVNDVRQMRLTGSAALTLDDRPVAASTPLGDSAVINLGGGVRVRYENLRLRRAARVAGAGRKKAEIRN